MKNPFLFLAMSFYKDIFETDTLKQTRSEEEHLLKMPPL